MFFIQILCFFFDNLSFFYNFARKLLINMKRLLLSVLALGCMVGNLFARVDRYKTDVGADKTINHITYVLPLHYTADRSNLEGSYTLATNIGNKKKGTLSFDFKQTTNKFSVELRDAILRVSRDLHVSDKSTISISFTLSSGETFVFDGSYFTDWKRGEWHELLHVTHNHETGEYNSFIMFPLEYLRAIHSEMPKKPASRYEYVLKALSKYNITNISIYCRSKSTNVRMDVPIDRPTAETIDHMLKKKTYAKERAKKENKKNKVNSGRR